MTEEHKELRRKLLNKEIDIHDLYEKYKVPYPSFITYEQSLKAEPDLTMEQYEAEVLSDLITMLFFQMGWAGLDEDPDAE